MIGNQNTETIEHLRGLKAQLDGQFESATAELEEKYNRQLAVLKEMGVEMVGEDFSFAAENGSPDKSINSQVIEALSNEYQTIEELASATCLTVPQVRSALYSGSNKTKIENRKTRKGRKKFRLRQAATVSSNAASKAQILKDGILRFVNENGPSSPGEIRVATIDLALTLFPKDESAKSAIRTHVLQLKRKGLLRYSDQSGRYSV